LPEALLLGLQCHQAAPADKFSEIHWESVFLMPCAYWPLVLPAQQQYLQGSSLPIESAYKADTCPLKLPIRHAPDTPILAAVNCTDVL